MPSNSVLPVLRGLSLGALAVIPAIIAFRTLGFVGLCLVAGFTSLFGWLVTPRKH